MFFQNPAWIWGMAAVAVPIALHFWHQQRARPMPWVMMRWLETPNQPPKRGFRFDNLWLLVLRCLLLTVLALLLARPDLARPDTRPQGAVHLVEPTQQVVNAFRFELQQARQRGDALFWATATPAPVGELGTLPDEARHPNILNPLQVQAAIDQVQLPQRALHLYMRNTAAWVDAPPVSVPAGFVLHALPAAPGPSSSRRVIALPNGRFLGTLANGRLGIRTQPAATGRMAATAPLPILMQFSRADERRMIRAALAALTSAYGLPFQIDEQAAPGKPYAWVLTDRPVGQPSPTTIYLTTAAPVQPDQPSVTYLAGPLDMTNPLVANGQLPEQLGTALANGLGLTAGPAPLPQQTFAALFVQRPAAVGAAAGLLVDQPRNALQTGLLVLFLSLLLIERWWAGRKSV